MIKLFNKWDSSIEVSDEGLKRYINLDPIIVPRTAGRNSYMQFAKSRYHILERLIMKLMVPGHRGKKHKLSSGHCCGNSVQAVRIVKTALEMLEKKFNKNPVEVFVKAIENSAPREEIITIEYGGARYPQAVECAPQRRIDIALRQMVQGAYAKAFGSKRKIEDCLAEEISLAYNLDQKSAAVSKKLELERQADASR